MQSSLQYIAKTGLATITTANTSLSGSGATEIAFLSEGDFGSIIKTIIIKAQTDTDFGMVRFFIDNGDTITLIMEVNIPALKKSGRDLSYYNVIPINYTLQNGDRLLASTQVSNTFNIIVEALDYKYNTDFDTNIVKYTSLTGQGILDTANSSLTGSGALVELLTPNPGVDGCEITAIQIKAMEDGEPGMIRFFIQDYALNDPVLFAEVIVPYALTSDGKAQSFAHQLISQGSLALQAGYKILGSTENSQQFSITIESATWDNP